MSAQARPAKPQPAPSSSTSRLRSGGSRAFARARSTAPSQTTAPVSDCASVPLAPATPRRCAPRSIGMTTRRPAPRSSSKVSAFGSTSGSSSPRARRPTRFASSPSDESSASCADIFIDQCGDTVLAMHGQWQRRLRGSEGSRSCVAAALCDVDDFFTALYSVYRTGARKTARPPQIH